MSEARRQLNIVFGIFGGAVIVFAIIKPSFSIWWFIKLENGGIVEPKILLIVDNLLSALTDIPSIFVILYIHHINFRPETLTSRKTIQYSQPVVTPTINENPSLSSI